MRTKRDTAPGRAFSELKEKLLADAEVRQAYEDEAPEFELVRSLLALRLERGMTQAELAQAAGTKQPAIARLESGHHRGVSLTTLEKLAHALNARLVVRLEPAEESPPSHTAA